MLQQVSVKEHLLSLHVESLQFNLQFGLGKWMYTPLRRLAKLVYICKDEPAGPKIWFGPKIWTKVGWMGGGNPTPHGTSNVKTMCSVTKLQPQATLFHIEMTEKQFLNMQTFQRLFADFFFLKCSPH